MFHKKLKPLALVAAIALGSALVLPLAAHADGTQDEIKALKAQLEMLNKKLDDLSKKQDKTDQKATTASEDAKKVTASFERIQIPQQPDSYKPGTVNMHTGAANPGVVDSANFLHRERDDSLTFGMPSGGGITLYGQLDVSADDVTNGLPGMVQGPNANHPGFSPISTVGMLPAISTNSTYVGLRGFQPIASWNNSQFLWQLQTNIALSAVAGTGQTNSAQNSTASGALTTGTSYIGFGGKEWGAVKVGKTFAPYQLSTQIFDPFAGKLGSMNVIMGNTGGDNRVEFGTIIEHSIWYESPNYKGLSFAALFSPGQNRSQDSSSIPQGGSNCAGGNVPGSGGLIGGAGSNIGSSQNSPDGCNDGGFNNAFSASLVYDDKTAWYLTAAYELHTKVNRGSDIVGLAGSLPGIPAGLASGLSNPLYDANVLNAIADDVGDEAATKIGVMYRFQSTGTTVGGIWEHMTRKIPTYLNFQNERQRDGTWLMIQQDLPYANKVSFGWGHADLPTGDAGGQHNYDPSLANNSTADMYTLLLQHQVDRNLSFYGNFAATVNHGNAHYDLGAGGHGVQTDCHDAGPGISASGGVDSSPQCWGGNHLEGISLGMNYRF